MKYKHFAAVVGAVFVTITARAAPFPLPSGFEATYGAIYNPVTNTTYLAVTQTDQLNTYGDAWNAINAIAANGGRPAWLATIYSAQENSFLVDGYAARGLDLSGYRMGATRSAQRDEFGTPLPDFTGPWYWNSNPDEPMVYSNWAPSQPDNFLGGQFLGIFFDNGMWDDTFFAQGLDPATGKHYHLGFVAEFAGNLAAAAVPEPGSYALLLIGLCAFVFAKRVRR